MSLSTLQRSRSRRPKPSSPATDNASPAPTRRAERRQAISRACLEALEDRRLMSFSPAVSYPVGASPQGIATADFDNDGRLDLVTASAGDNTVSALLGNGDGTFQPAQTSAGGPDGIYSGSLTVGDVNADGNLDLAAADYFFDGGVYDTGIRTRLGNGDGTFAPAVQQNVRFSWHGNSNYDMAFADLNADRKLDAVVMVYEESASMSGDAAKVGVLIGCGDGTFAHGIAYTVYFSVNNPITLHSPVLVDFNRDGNLDLAVGETTHATSSTPPIEQVKVFLGNGDGTLRPPRDSDANPYIIDSLTAGDFTSDGIPDLVANGNGAVSVLPGRGDGTFAAPIVRSAPAATRMAPENFDGDGRLDLVTLDATTDSGGVGSLLLGRGDGTFHATEGFDVGRDPTAIATGDYNGDGRPDFVVTHSDSVSGAVSVLLNDGTWSPLPASVSISDATVTEGNTGTVNAAFTLTLSRATDVDVRVQFYTTTITAAAGSDYTAASGTVTIPAGQTRATLTVAVNGDRLAEPGETFSINLIDATNATIGDGLGVGTILDDEPSISIGDVSSLEGKNGRTTQLTFTATLSAAYDQPVTTSFRTADGTARLSDRDYVAKTGTITFNPGETSKTITIDVRGDSRREANEVFYLDLFGGSSNSLFARSRGIGTILNDD